MSHTLQAFHRRSIESPDAFWDEQARRIDWHTPYRQVLDDSQPPFRRWFVDGTTNLCHNAVDRHLAERGDQAALIHISTETGAERQYSYAELHREVNRCAAVLSKLGVSKGDRVLIYMPMIPEAIFAMLATVRLGAIHSVVFGGFASASLATRIDDAQPKVIFTADAGMRGGKHIPYKPLVDAAIDLAGHKPEHVVIVERGLDPDMPITQCRDLIYATLLGRLEQTEVPCEWVESNHPSYILYTSGTTGKPKGVQRDTGGYAVALAASMENIYCGAPGETFFCTSDIGWVVGHSYIVYAPLLRGMTTIVYEGLPTRPDPGVWWSIVEKYRVSVMFSAPTALRALKKQDPAWLKKYDLSSLRYLFMAGEPLDQLPPDAGVGTDRQPFVHQRRQPGQQRRVHDVRMPHHPADVGGREHRLALATAIDMRHRGGQRDGVAAGVALHALGLAGGSRGIEDVRRRRRFEPDDRHLRTDKLLTQARVIDVAASHLGKARVKSAIDHQDLGRLVPGLRDRFVEQMLVRNRLAAAHSGVGRNDQLGRRVVDAGRQRTGGKAAEDHRVDRANARTGEHRESRLGNHRHVDQHAVALTDAQALHHRRHAHHFLLELGKRIDDLAIGLGRNKDQRSVVRTFGCMPIDRVVAKIGGSADEPLGKRRT